jgi:dihydroflavonol-4-reductase
VKKRADTGWPIVTTLPTAPIGPHDLRPTPTGMIIVAFLKGRIPLLARTGLNFVDVRDCALGHLLTMARAKSGERHLLGGINLWLCDFLKRVEPTLATVRHVFMRRIGSAFLPLAPAKLPGGFGRTGLRL